MRKIFSLFFLISFLFIQVPQAIALGGLNEQCRSTSACIDSSGNIDPNLRLDPQQNKCVLKTCTALKNCEAQSDPTPIIDAVTSCDHVVGALDSQRLYPSNSKSDTCICKTTPTPETPASAGEALAQLCKPEDPTCTSAKGVGCETSSGNVVDKGNGVMTAIGCVPTEPKALIESILRFGTLAAGGVAFLIMIIASLQMITAEGNPEILKNARDKFYSAIIGLLLIIFAVLLMQVIGVDILGLPGFG